MQPNAASKSENVEVRSVAVRALVAREPSEETRAWCDVSANVAGADSARSLRLAGSRHHG
jgi:hypothetical protein